ncbi:MAG: hypothetical protein CM1200mP24_07940 [Gammaproteobacteria bacterium]|nr:MAG: hypothetical protein CM1200mP24_07940 [Gammaproteobacteria bacterium]
MDSAYNAKGIASLFVDDGIWDGGFRGRLKEQKPSDPFRERQFRHGFCNSPPNKPIIEISPEDNNRALGSWYLGNRVPKPRAPKSLWLAANFKDTYTKTKHGWQF